MTIVAIWRICLQNSQIFEVTAIMIILSWIAGFCLFAGSMLNGINPEIIIEKIQNIRINTTINTRNIKRTALCALCISIIIISPALADTNTSSMTAGQQMIRGGIDSWIIGQCDNMIDVGGVSMGNVSNLTDATAMERIIYALATYEQHPYEVGWIREEVKTDYIIYSHNFLR